MVKPIADKTWVKFKEHFTDAWNELRLPQVPTMKDTSFHQQANIIKQEVMAAMQEEQAAMVQEVKESNESILVALQTAPVRIRISSIRIFMLMTSH